MTFYLVGRCMRAHPSTKFRFNKLAERIARQFVDELDGIGTLDTGELVAAERYQFRLRQRGAGPQHHEGMHLLAPFLVRSRHNRGLSHAWVPADDLLDFLAGDVEAAADDDVALAIDDVDVALGIDGREITRMQPAVLDRGLGALGI